MMIDTPSRQAWRGPLGVFCLALAARLAALPWAQTYDGDAVTRTYTAWRWLEAPHFITHDIWPPLHNYLLALSLWIYHDPILTPPILTALLSAGTASALFLFTRREFEPRAAWFVSCAFAFYPPAFRNSLMALSETPFMFFLAWALVFLARARSARGGLWPAVFAGLALTLAAALRYEAWIMISMLALVLWRRPRSAAAFVLAAVLFPAFWMVSNAKFGPDHDPLYGIHNQAEWEAHLVNASGGLSFARRVLRVLFIPVVLTLGLSLVGLTAAYGIVRVLRERRAEAIWLIPTGLICAAYVYKAATGSLAMDPRYTLIVGMMLIPFAAGIYLRTRPPSKPLLFALVLGTFVLPYGYSYAVQLLGKAQPAVIERIDQLSTSMDMQRVLEPIPRWTKDAPEIIHAIQDGGIDHRSDGLVCVDLDWQVAQQVCLATGMRSDQRLLLPAGFRKPERRQQQLEKLAAFLDARPQGYIVVKKGPAAETIRRLGESISHDGAKFARRPKVQLVADFPQTEVFRYE